jgi:hypothetical protein
LGPESNRIPALLAHEEAELCALDSNILRSEILRFRSEGCHLIRGMTQKVMGICQGKTVSDDMGGRDG